MVARMTVVPLTVDEYATTIRNAARFQQSGGTIFDALLLACARKVHAEQIYTWNEKHFRMIAPDLADRIVTP
jgi:predicted nucleic acid-binding protein